MFAATPTPVQGPKLRRMPSMHNLGITRSKVTEVVVQRGAMEHQKERKGGVVRLVKQAVATVETVKSQRPMRPLAPFLNQPSCSSSSRRPRKSTSFTDLCHSATGQHYSHAGIELSDPVLPLSFAHFDYYESTSSSSSPCSFSNPNTATAQRQAIELDVQPSYIRPRDKYAQHRMHAARRRSPPVPEQPRSRRKPVPSMSGDDDDAYDPRREVALAQTRRKLEMNGSPRSFFESSVYAATTPSTSARQSFDEPAMECVKSYGTTLVHASEDSLLAPSTLSLETPLSSSASLPASLQAAVRAASATSVIVPEAAAAAMATATQSCGDEQPPPVTIQIEQSTPPRARNAISVISKQPSRRSLILAENTFHIPPVHRKPQIDVFSRRPSQPAPMRRPSGFGIFAGGVGGFSGSLRTLFAFTGSRARGREFAPVFADPPKAYSGTVKRKAATLPRHSRTGQVAISEPIPIYPATIKTRCTIAGNEQEWRQSLLVQAVGHSLRGASPQPNGGVGRRRPRIPSGLTVPLDLAGGPEPISPSLTLTEEEVEARRELESQDDGGHVLEEPISLSRPMTPLANPLPPPPRSRRVSGKAEKALAVKSWDDEKEVACMPDVSLGAVNQILLNGSPQRQARLRKDRISAVNASPKALAASPSVSGRGNLHVLVPSAETSVESLDGDLSDSKCLHGQGAIGVDAIPEA